MSPEPVRVAAAPVADPPPPVAASGDGTDHRRSRLVLGLLALIAIAATAAYLLYDIEGSWSFALELRTRRVAAMALVGVAIGCSTVLFQTVTGNRILTPSIMGFDAMYVLIQTLAVYLLGSITLIGIDDRAMFAFEVVAMVGFASVLHRWLFGRRARDLYVLVLVGIVFGTMFGSITSLVTRLIDPNEFLTLQDMFFASFGSVDDDLLVISAAIVVVAMAACWRALPRLDVVALGRDTALNLGVDHQRVVTRALVLVAVLVSVSTALIGPITFLGLLVANLGYQLLGTFRHRYTIPAASLLGVIALVGGQFVLQHLLDLETTLSVIINFAGGIYFIGMLIRESRP